MIYSVLILASLSVGACGRAPSTQPASQPATHPATQATPAQSQPADAIDVPDLDRNMRVLLLDQTKTARLVLREHYNLYDPRTRELLQTDLPPGDLTITFARAGIDFAELNLQTDREMIDVIPLGEQPTQVRLTEDWKDFRGTIRLHDRDNGGAVVNLIEMEDYLVSVVAAELPASFEREAFRAQAIVARTYAWYARQTSGRRRDWDVWATQRSQVYRGIEREKLVPQAADAVRDTRGIVLTWTGPQGEKILCSFFSSRCGGTTAAAPSIGADAPIPPLAGGVSCEYCRRSDAYRWPAEPRLNKLLIGERLADRYTRFAALTDVDRVEVTSTTPEGRALRIAVTDLDGQAADIDAESFRLTVDPTGRLIQSTWFNIVDDLDAVILNDGKGMGHGMGLCQYGADAMAEAGRTAPEILTHYFPTSHLTRAY